MEELDDHVSSKRAPVAFVDKKGATALQIFTVDAARLARRNELEFVD